MGGRPSGSGQPDRDGGCHQRQGLCFPRATFGSGGEGFSGLWGGLAAHVVLSLNFISSYSDEKACHYTFFEKLNHCQWTTYESLVSNGSQAERQCEEIDRTDLRQRRMGGGRAAMEGEGGRTAVERMEQSAAGDRVAEAAAEQTSVGGGGRGQEEIERQGG